MQVFIIRGVHLVLTALINSGIAFLLFATLRSLFVLKVRPDKNREFLLWVFVFYTLFIYSMTIYRNGIDFSRLFQNGEIHIIPFIDSYIQYSKSNVWYFIYLFGGNIIWFLPIGFMLPKLWSRYDSVKNIIVYGVLFSLSIEILQFVLGTGISEIDDVILNTLGVLMGYGCYKKLKRIKKDADNEM